MTNSTTPIPVNCFNPRGYVKSDAASGLLSTRYGQRLIAVPEVLLRCIPQTLRVEAGEASYLALYTFGNSWGQSFCDRMMQDMLKYDGQPVLQTISAEFFVKVQSVWAVHGLGQPSIDFRLANRGLLIVTILNSGISSNTTIDDKSNYRSFSLEAGFLAGWFSSLTKEKLRACAFSWSDAPASMQFLVGNTDHIETIENIHLKDGMLNSAQLHAL
jgi:uncharacterized protein